MNKVAAELAIDGITTANSPNKTKAAPSKERASRSRVPILWFYLRRFDFILGLVFGCSQRLATTLAHTSGFLFSCLATARSDLATLANEIGTFNRRQFPRSSRISIACVAK